MNESRLGKEFDEALKLLYKLKLYSNFLKAQKNKDKIKSGIPDEGKALSFCVKKVWHNGFYKDGFFFIVGDRTKQKYSSNKWYYL